MDREKMNEFSPSLTPGNKDNFPGIRFETVLSCLRQEITENVLRGDENDFFDLSTFSRKYGLTDSELTDMRSAVSAELEALGWSVKTSFGGTGLFVYSSEKPPPSCHADGF
jgi:hypothetical protein